jgi:Leucine-rich repeat (LRR) protein
VGNLLPLTLESLIAHDAFVGSMVDGVPVPGTTLSVLNSLPNLKVFRVGRLNSSFRSSVGPDSVDTVGYFPDVALTESGTSAIVEYTVRDTTLRDLTRLTNLRTLSPELVTLDLGANNSASSSNFSVNSDKIQTVNVAGTRINIMDMRNRTELINYAGNQVNQLPEPHSLFVNSNPTDADYKFFNCSKLQTIALQNSTYTGYFPKLAGNSSLVNFDASNTQLSGGRPGILQTSVAQQVTNSRIINVLDASGIVPEMFVSGAGIPANTQVVSVKNNRVEVGITIAALSVGVTLNFGNHVLAEDTFVDCVNLRAFNFSSSFMFSFSLHPNVFTALRNLDFLRIQSNGRLSGALPVFSNCVNLSSIDLSNNAFIGAVPAFITNTRLTSVQLSNNRLTGTLPVWNLPNLVVLNLTNNRISAFGTNGSTSTLGSLPRLRQLRLNFNQISNALPILSDQTPLLERLEIQNNQITTYVQGTLTRCNRLTFINFSNNRLNQTAVNNIILDVDQSVQLTRRSGTLTILGAQNAAPSSTSQIISALARLRAAGWQVQTNSL